MKKKGDTTYKTENLEKLAIEAIVKKKLVFFDEVHHFLPCCHETLYQHKLNKSEKIKNAMFKNRIDMKRGLRHKWYNNDNATTQIILYKLIGTEEELERISLTKNKVEIEDKREKWLAFKKDIDSYFSNNSTCTASKNEEQKDDKRSDKKK